MLLMDCSYYLSHLTLSDLISTDLTSSEPSICYGWSQPQQTWSLHCARSSLHGCDESQHTSSDGMRSVVMRSDEVRWDKRVVETLQLPGQLLVPFQPCCSSLLARFECFIRLNERHFLIRVLYKHCYWLYNLYCILHSLVSLLCELAFDNFLIKELDDDDDVCCSIRKWNK